MTLMVISHLLTIWLLKYYSALPKVMEIQKQSLKVHTYSIGSHEKKKN